MNIQTRLSKEVLRRKERSKGSAGKEMLESDVMKHTIRVHEEALYQKKKDEYVQVNDEYTNCIIFAKDRRMKPTKHGEGRRRECKKTNEALA